MKADKKSILGWGMSVLLALFLIIPSAGGKFTDWEGKEQMFEHLGYSTELMSRIGVVEVVVALLILIPQTAFVGGILLTVYLGGAVATHVRVGDPYFMPILVGIFLWIALGLRRPEIFSLALGVSTAGSSDVDVRS